VGHHWHQEGSLPKLTYLISLNAEVKIQWAGVILQNPAQGIVILRINPLHIPIIDGLA